MTLFGKNTITRTENGRTSIYSHNNIFTLTRKCTIAAFVKSLLILVTWLNFGYYALRLCQEFLELGEAELHNLCV